MDSIELYILSDSNELNDDSLFLKLEITFSLINSLRNVQESKEDIITAYARPLKKKGNIYLYKIDSNDALDQLNDQNDNFKIVINNIELQTSKTDVIVNELYNLDLHLGEYANSQNQPSFDFSSLFEVCCAGNYTQNLYKIKQISSCTDEYKFNLAIDNDINVRETKLINLVFKGINRRFEVNARCTLSPNLKKLITCQADDETRDLNYTMNDYLFINENELLFITLDNDVGFPLYCYEKPPIGAIIAIAAVFVLVLIIVFIIIIYINKKGKEDLGYEAPNNSNSNNVIGISSGPY